MHIAIQTNRRNRSARIVTHPAASARQVQKTDRLAIPVAEGMRFIKHAAIVYCTAESNYCRIMLADGRNMLFSKTLKWVADRLPESIFVRSHASHLVNVDFIELYTQDFLQLQTGDKMPVSRSRRSEVRERLCNDH